MPDNRNRDIEHDAAEGERPVDDENEGEGSKSADRAYRRDVDDFLQHEDPSKLARQAAADIDKDPERYREAERAGKSRIAEEDPEVDLKRR